MFLISRANSLPRRASLTAFWCLVVAHLEWPLIAVLSEVLLFLWPDESTWAIGVGCPVTAPSSQRPQESQHGRDELPSMWRMCPPRSSAGDKVDEQVVDAPVAGHLGVKRSGQLAALLYRDDVASRAGQHLDVVAGALDPGGADEYRAHRIAQSREWDVTLERIDLSPK